MQRPQRVRKKTFKASDSQLNAASVSAIADSRVAKKRKLHALQPVPAEQVAAPEILVDPLPNYQPPLRLQPFSSRPRIRPQSPIKAFQIFLTHEIVKIIVANTNSYADDHREAADSANTPRSRPWRPTRASEMWRYIGCLIYMGIHIEKERGDYWQDSHRLGVYLSRTRFEQIHRYFTIRDGSVYPPFPNENFTWHLEPVATKIRLSYQQNWSPGSHLTIDESMIPYRGRSEHTVKMKNKPISEGYKVWVLADHGYIWSFLWYSCTIGTEGIHKKQGLLVDLPIPFRPVRLASTFATVIRLAQQLRIDPVFPRVHCLFLDNLFLNQDVCLTLLALNIACMGTTRKNAIGISPKLITMKQQNRGLVWNSASAEIKEGVLQFLWQDNNTVLGMTTAYSLHQTIWRERKRPALTSTNAHIVRPVFGDAVKKWLQIPLAIDEYNHGMNGVDRANQLQRSYTTHRPQVYRTWHPQWHWLLDTCATNAFLMLNNGQEDKDLSHRAHHDFQEDLALGLLTIPDDGPEQVAETIQTGPQPVPRWRTLPSCKRCEWCREHPANSAPRAKRRKVLAEIVNGVSEAHLPQSRAACGCHGVALCRKGDCWDLYHTQIAETSQ